MSADAFRQLLEDGDVKGLRQAWSKIAPNMPQPETFEAAEITMHMTRTASASVSLKARAYSHRWLSERLLPSQLPDDLKPEAERLYPRIVSAVGVSVNFRSKLLAPAAAEVQSAINDAIEDCYAEGHTDPQIVKRQMDEARDKTMQALFGR